MADESKTEKVLGIPPTTPKPEKRAIALGSSKPASENHSRGDAFRTFLWVAPLTALIWIYAEREQIDRAAEVQVKINFASKSSDRIITVVGPVDLSDSRRTTASISLDIQGPRASLSELRDLLAKGPIEVPINPNIGYDGEIAVAEHITKSELFKSHAATVTAARPSVRIRVEPKASRRIAVKVRPQDKFVGTVVFEPEFVTLEGPKDSLAKLKPEDLVALADMTAFLQKRPASTPYVEDVPIGLPTFGDSFSLPAAVRAKVTITASENYAIPPISIDMKIPGPIVSSDKFLITTKTDTLSGVEVTGPPDAIELLRQRKFPAAVILDLKNIDFSTIQGTVEKAVTLKPSDYQMPVGVEVRNAVKDITVTITRRGA